MTDDSSARRYLRLCLGSQWSPSALDEARILSLRTDFDWAALLQCAFDEGAAPPWYGVVRGRDLVPPAIETELQAAYREAALRNTALFAERDRILRELHRDGIEVILLKGAALAETVYGDIALRPMSDLDLLVRPGDVSAIMRQLARAGYHAPIDLPRLDNMPVEFENELPVFKPEDVRYRCDIHWGLLAAPYYQRQLPPDWLWATSQPLEAIGVPARVLGPEAQVLHLTAHLMLSHQGHGLRWWYDVGLVSWTYRRQIDWNLLCERAQMYDLVLPAQRVLLELVEQWQLPIPIAAVEQLRALSPSPREQQMYVRLTSERSSLRRYWGDLLSIPDWPGRLRYTGRKLFPSATYMRWRYALPQPWLLPLAYPYRWVVPVWRAARERHA